MGRENHAIRVVVWDVPPAIEVGHAFRIKVGVRCDGECDLAGRPLSVIDHTGLTLASAVLGSEPWRETTALYFADVMLEAPADDGSHDWDARVPAITASVAHDAGHARFRVRFVRAPECRLRVKALDAQSGVPVGGAKVVAHPYRSQTDEHGVAELSVPRGTYRIFVSGRDYFPFRHDAEIDADTTIDAALELDPAPTDAEIWA